MAPQMMKPVGASILVLNLCMYIIVCAIAGWALNKAIDHEIIMGEGIPLPNAYSGIYFPMGNAATGFFIIFSLIAGVVGAASCLSGLHHLRSSTGNGGLVSGALMAWGLTLLAMGLAWKEIDLHGRNSRLKTVESFVIILSATQLVYVAVLIVSNR